MILTKQTLFVISFVILINTNKAKFILLLVTLNPNIIIPSKTILELEFAEHK